MPGLPPTIQLAQKMGAQLGSGHILLEALPRHKRKAASEMRKLIFILGDQLSPNISSLTGIDRDTDIVLMVEVVEETTYVPHHKQKIAFILSAMRHFANELRSAGIEVDYVALGDAGNTGSFSAELDRAIERHNPDRIVITEPGEWRVRRIMDDWGGRFDRPIEIRADDRFLCSIADFRAWADGRKSYRMEYFYREMRRRTGLLMDGDYPAGGTWNLDTSNRKPLPASIQPPRRICFEIDEITAEVISLTSRYYPDNFGTLDAFNWAVTREDALVALAHFIEFYLPLFGDYQDAMATDEPFLFHAVLSPYLNVGLLEPREVCIAAEAAFRCGSVPLNAAEGFIRQILGWREYVRGIYWLEMPGYKSRNALSSTRQLPWFYWSGETEMHCLKCAIEDTKRSAYAHHIQRLMVTGNFALLAGVNPAEIEEWYLAVYADAFEWVELPNVHGMVMFADGGLLSSKPYAASGAYINRMSNYCQRCVYDPKIKTGRSACPFNFLYWNFLIQNRSELSRNPRMKMAYRTLDHMEPVKIAAVRRDARDFLEQINENSPRKFRSDLFDSA